ncbi:MAG TPA: CHAP domain-containing protein [Actinophytocola sp.]|jgi:hypothetical protein|uniref:SH3 domain-containing protein n=1 Tax=Actinophytocola sp. TaxID=1872138 RepID=UPI002F94524D
MKHVKKVAAAALGAVALTIGLAVPAFAASIDAYVTGTEGQPLMVRSGPGTGYSIIDQLGPDQHVTISCQDDGDVVNGTGLWDYLPAFGGYASDAYLYTGYDGRHPDLGPCDDSPAPPPSSIGDEISRVAQGQVGNTDGWSYHEGQGSPSDAWCQYFVNWVWRTAGVPDMFSADGFTGDFYYWALDRGLVRDGYHGISVGDAVLFGTGPADPSTSLHVGTVVAVHEDGSIESVDGNYAGAVAHVGPYYPGSATTHEPGNVYAVVAPPA